MKYCSKCGKEIFDEAVICPGCGCPTGPNTTQPTEQLFQSLSQRYNINGIIWIVIGAIQVVLGLAWNWWLMIVAVLNIITGVQDMTYSKTVLSRPAGIVDKVQPLAGPIITLIYNAIFGGIIGVAGSIYYLVGIRGFVLENAKSFQ